MSNTARLFEPVRLGNLQLPNRIAMAPMTREHAPGGIPGPANAEYYRKRVAHEVGLIITEGTYIDHPAAGESDKVPVFHGAAALAGWQTVVDAVHAAGGKIFPQLWHIGMQRKPGWGGVASVGPSGIAFSAREQAWRQTQAPLTESGIADLIQSFARAAAAARRIGCDGVELHGAHGYLIDQFFWNRTNVRNDGYNGDSAARTRFGCEVVREIKRQAGADFPVCLRFSQWKSVEYGSQIVRDTAELERFLAPLVDAGVDIFHASVRRYWTPAFGDHGPTLAGLTRKLTGKPVITVGTVGLDSEHRPGRTELTNGYTAQPTGVERLLELLDEGDFDVVAVGRALLADPAWASKLRRNAIGEMTPYSSAIRNVFN